MKNHLVSLRKFFLLAVLLWAFSFAFEANAQRDSTRNDSPPPSWKDRIRLGGNFGLQFGTVTFIDVSPLVLYQVSSQVQLGVGVSYQYIRFNFPTFRSEGNSIYGGRGFGRLFVMPNVFAQAEYEMLSTRYYDGFAGQLRREWIPAAFLGGGYSQSVGGRVNANMTILYNLLYQQYRTKTVYASPWVIRVGFNL